MKVYGNNLPTIDEEKMGKLTCFKAYDIRGRLGDELNNNIAKANSAEPTVNI